jgi:hypothetical protein
MAKEAAERARRRYLSLIDQLEKERGSRWGWQTEVAKLISVDSSYLATARTRGSVGIDAVERAIKGLGLDRQYFYGEGPDEIDYHGFLISRVDEELAYAELQRFLETPIGATATGDEIAELRMYRGKKRPDLATYQTVLVSIIRARRPSPEQEMDPEAKERAEKKGARPAKPPKRRR